MKTISCYSYKGGTGRSTSTANLATALAKNGKNILVIDLDIEAPGLSVVFDVEGEEKVTIQQYLNNPSDYNYSDLIIDLKESSRKDETKFNWPDNVGNCYFIPAKIGVEVDNIVSYEEDRIHSILRNLLRDIKEDVDLAIDYIVLDTASGYSDMSAVAMALSDLLLIFFRWSRQHLTGTIKIASFFKFLVETKGQELDYQFVANCVPHTEENADYFKLKQGIQEHLERAVGKDLFAELPENNLMKWNEQVIIFNDKEKGDQDLANAFNKLAVDSIRRLEQP